MIKLIYVLIIFTIWGIVDYVNVRLVFEKLFIMEKPEGKNYKYIWLFYYFVITYLFCLSKYNNITEIYFITYFLYYLRAVPLLWSKYGANIKIAVFIIFYEEMEALISSNISIIIYRLSKNSFNEYLLNDLYATVSAVIFLITFILVLYFRKSRMLDIWFANLAIREYLLLMLTIYILGNIESEICLGENYSSFMQILMLALTLLTCIIITRVIIVKERNYSMDNIIAILGEQMEKLTGHYNELNKKEIQLRQFRHDTKNLLLVLHSMIENGKNDKALNYIEKIETMYQKTTKAYDTGNFIADALISYKAHEAEKFNTKIYFNGIMPDSKVSDVDMVILLSNILDNALEACEKIEGEKKIIIDSVINKQIWVLTVKNPVKENINIQMNQLETSKENKKLHGYGIINMEKVTDSYNGLLKLECYNGEFFVRVTLMLNDKV